MIIVVTIFAFASLTSDVKAQNTLPQSKKLNNNQSQKPNVKTIVIKPSNKVYLLSDVQSFINVNLNEKMDLELSDEKNNVVWRKSYSAGEYKVDLQGYSSGIYFLRGEKILIKE